MKKLNIDTRSQKLQAKIYKSKSKKIENHKFELIIVPTKNHFQIERESIIKKASSMSISQQVCW